MKHTTRIIAKPHVAQYLRSVFSTDGFICINEQDKEGRDLRLIPPIVICLTEEFKKRFDGYPSDRYEEIEVVLPPRYKNHFLDQSMAVRLARFLDEYFWSEVKLFIYEQIYNGVFEYKDEAIHAFCLGHGITESLYPIDHFRRQLNRKKIKGTVRPAPPIKNRISHKLDHQQCMQIWRLVKQRKISYRKVAICYNISHETVRKIMIKINNKVVQKVDKRLTQDHVLVPQVY